MAHQKTKMLKNVDAAFVALRRAILDRALEPGARLPAESIGSGFGMSRTLAREVLLKLEGIGLVEIRPKRGAIVACPSFSEVQEVFEVRQCLEEKCISRLCDNWTSKIEQELEKHVNDEAKAEKKGRLNVSIKLAEEFHIKLGQMSGNKVLSRYLEEIVSRCSLILALYGRPYATECSIPEHKMIVAALKKGDKSEAIKVMQAHIIELQNCAEAEEEEPSKLALNQVINHYTQKQRTPSFSGKSSVQANATSPRSRDDDC